MLRPEVTTWLDGGSLDTGPTVRGDPGAPGHCSTPWKPLRLAGPAAGPTHLPPREPVVGQPSFVIGRLASLPGEATVLGTDDRPGSSGWFAYEAGGEVRACVLVDVFGDPRGRLASRCAHPGPRRTVPASPPSRRARRSATWSRPRRVRQGGWSEPTVLADEVRLYDAGDYFAPSRPRSFEPTPGWSATRPSATAASARPSRRCLRHRRAALPLDGAGPGRSAAGDDEVVTVGPPEVTSCQPRGPSRSSSTWTSRSSVSTEDAPRDDLQRGGPSAAE